MYEKLSTYISSVAGPFHPFGGAVDIIVVQQQDGSFKSTPWYVRFGKFQGVLKRSEEIVTVAVNGIEAGFHMHLVDNTGQAYLLREVESDEKEDDEKSDSSVDEAVSASRRESFKSAESRGEVEEQDIDIIDDHGDDEEEANGIRSSLELDSLDSISMVRQRNGDILISFGERSPKFSDMQTRNGLVDASSKYSPNRTYKSKARESNSETELDKRVNLALSPSGNVSTEQNYFDSIVQEELANGNEIQSVHNHLESSTVQNVDTAFLKKDTVGQSEYLGRGPNSKWDSYKEASVFTMEESSGISIVSATNTSGTDDFLLSRYSAYDYEHMDLPQSEDALDARKDEDVNSEVVLMSVDGYVMTAPISSFKHSENVGLCGHQMKTVLIHDGDGHSEDKIVPSGAVENSSIECGTDNHDLEHTEIINSSDTLVEDAATWKPEGIMQTQCGFSVSEIFLESEVDSKKTGPLSDSIDNQVHNGIEGHLKKKVDAHDMPRTESEIEFNFNDEDIFKSCLALSELCPPIGEEEGQNSLSPHLEEEEEYDDGTSLSDGIQTESSLGAFQLGTPQVLHAESSNISEHMDNCNFEHLSGSMSDCPRKESNPIHIPGLHIKGRGARGQLGRSLPNMGFASSSLETSVSEHVFSHSFDSSFYKRTSTNDILTSSFGNMEPNVFKEEYIRAAQTSELYQLNDKDTSNKSLQTDVVTDVEISLCGDLLKKGMGTEAAAQAFDSKRVLREEFMCSGAEIVKNEKLIVRIGGQYYPWSAVAHVILGKFAFNLESPAELEGKISVEHIETEAVRDSTSESNVSSSGRWRLWPFPFRRLKTPDKSTSEKSASKVEFVADLEVASQNASEKESDSKNPSSSPPQKRKLRMDTPTSEQLASLNLKEGQNMITFTILTSIWGKQQVDARIYLWKWNTRIVISDVDGTITKSDVLGQVMPLVGKDWTQTGVARLFSAIKDNGYQLLFLSARAIVQAYLTRQFLLNLKQDGEALPDGPVLISPDGLFPSLYREVIRRAPHEFKIACLENIRQLFPPDCNPFYAGFGNRDTDEISYLKVGIPKGKIFIINPKGVVVVNHCVEVKSYTSLHKLADDIFPPMPSCEQEDFNSWNYWKLPVPDIEDEV